MQEFENTHYFSLVGEVQSDRELQTRSLAGGQKLASKSRRTTRPTWSTAGRGKCK